MADDVAYALLDATRRMSISRGMNNSSSFSSSASSNEDTQSQLSSSVGSSSTSGGWFDSWKSNSELDDKTGSLPKEAGTWFSQPSRNRAFSESEGTGRVKFGVIGGWFGQGKNTGFMPRKLSEPHNDAGRVRRSSSKDVEEAMAGGLNKADIYMPPF